MISVVLVEPEGEENVGFVARAMKNMGVENLVIINPRCNYLSKNALFYSVHANDILKKARLYENLESALKEADISVAITRRTGQWRIRDFVLEDFSKYIKDYENKKVYLVFGREKFGLTNEEIRKCDLICSIPSSEKFPSLNLSHAVIVVLYDIYRETLQKKLKTKDNPADRKNFDSMLKTIISTLDELDFFKNVPSWRLENYIKKILLRSKLKNYDCMVIEHLFARIRGQIKQYKKDLSK